MPWGSLVGGSGKAVTKFWVPAKTTYLRASGPHRPHPGCICCWWVVDAHFLHLQWTRLTLTPFTLKDLYGLSWRMMTVVTARNSRDGTKNIMSWEPRDVGYGPSPALLSSGTLLSNHSTSVRHSFVPVFIQKTSMKYPTAWQTLEAQRDQSGSTHFSMKFFFWGRDCACTGFLNHISWRTSSPKWTFQVVHSFQQKPWYIE